MMPVFGDEQTLEKGKNDRRVGDTETNVKTNDDSTVRLFALAFTDFCPEQVKVEHYTQTSQIVKIWKEMHEILYETVMEPAMHVVIQAVLLLYPFRPLHRDRVGRKGTGSRTPCSSTRVARCRTRSCSSTLRTTT